MTNPLTYLDEVDARVAVEADRLAGSVTRSDARLLLARQDVPALSKALRAVFAIHPREVIAVHEGYGEEAWCPRCKEHYPCETVRAIQAALAVNDEGGK